jgi:hypothetical protein
MKRMVNLIHTYDVPKKISSVKGHYGRTSMKGNAKAQSPPLSNSHRFKKAMMLYLKWAKCSALLLLKKGTLFKPFYISQ